MGSPASAPRLAPLDALRGFAALAVVVWHYGTGLGATPMQGLLAPFYLSGGYAVVFFFLLSGYVLSHAYMAPLHYATLILIVGA